MSKFLSGLKTQINGLTATVNSMTYLPWVTAVSLSGRPEIRVLTSQDGSPLFRLFGGGYVAVESSGQVVTLPVLNSQNKPISADAITSRDVSDSVNRCRAKACAIVHGVGLSVFAGFGEDAKAFMLSMTPALAATDLSKVEPKTKEKGGHAFVDWSCAIAAAKLSDSEFIYRLEEFDVTDENGEIRRMPACRTNGTWSVAVTTTYKGQSHTEWLPVMGFQYVATKSGNRKMDHQALTNPSVFDWNTAVMRCLTKAIAISTGYGLSVYAGEDNAALQQNEEADVPAEMPAQKQTYEAASSKASEEIALIGKILIDRNKTVEDLMIWLGKSGQSLMSLSDAERERAIRAMSQKAAA